MKMRYILTFGILVTMLASACKKDNATPQTNIKLSHMSANAPTVDLSINNALFIGNISYPSSTSYRSTDAGNIALKIGPTGTTTATVNINGSFLANKFYSIYVFDSLANLKFSVMEDDKSVPPAGKTFVRFLHLGTSQGPVDIIKAGGPVRLFTNRSFNDHSTNAALTAYTAIDPGPFSVSAIVAGSVNTLVTQLPSFNATAGKSYTLVLRGFKNATPLSAQVLFLSPIDDTP